MSEVLFEIGTEEIPADYLEPAARNIKENLEKQFAEKRLKTQKISVFYTLRRFVAFIEGVSEKQDDLSFTKRGPSYEMAYSKGALTELGNTFLSKNNIKETDLQFKEEKGKKYIYIEGVDKGRPTSDILAGLLPEIISGIRFPKSMIWDDSGVTFARPIRWILAIMDAKVIDFKYGHLKSGNKTRLHKFLQDNKETAANSADDYFRLMLDNGIEVVPGSRRGKVEQEIMNALKPGFSLIKDDELLRRVADSVESVSVMTGEFDKKYLSLPEQVIITAMREHQRYFAVSDAEGKLTNLFVNVRDGGTANNAAITKQHAEVLFSRLNDAEFFYNEDLKKPLEENLPVLKRSAFTAGLGTMYEKTLRIKGTIEEAEGLLKYKNKAALLEAAMLSKADLATNMVGEKEYVTLRGFIGGVYLKKQGKNEAVCKAVSEQYLPNFVGDKLPSTDEGVVLSIVDKVDNITGFFIAGFKPTGSKDPYAVRRQALTVLYIITEKKMGIDLGGLIEFAAAAYKEQLGKQADVNELKEFFSQREINYLKDSGLDYDLISAVAGKEKLDIINDMDKVKLLMDMRASGQAFNNFVFAMSRISNIIKDHKSGTVDEKLFEEDAERQLWGEYSGSRHRFMDAAKDKNNAECLKIALSIEKSVNLYFDKVLVNCENEKLRNNRLNMLVEMKKMLFSFVDFDKIVIDRK